MTSQFALLVRSFSQLKHNLVLTVPLLLYYAAYVPLSVIMWLLVLVPVGVFFASRNMALSVSVGVVLLSFAVFLFFAVCIFFQAAVYGMVCDVILKGKTSFDRIMFHGKGFFMPLLRTFFAYLVIMVVFFLVAGVLPALAFFAFGFAGAVALGVVALVAYIIAMLVFSALSVFSLPIVFLEGVSGFRAVKLALRYGVRNLSHTVSVVGVLLLVVLAFMGIFLVVSLPLALAEIAAESGGIGGAGYLVATLIFGMLVYGFEILASLVLSVVIPAFIFNSYIDRNTVKKWK